MSVKFIKNVLSSFNQMQRCSKNILISTRTLRSVKQEHKLLSLAGHCKSSMFYTFPDSAFSFKAPAPFRTLSMSTNFPPCSGPEEDCNILAFVDSFFSEDFKSVHCLADLRLCHKFLLNLFFI